MINLLSPETKRDIRAARINVVVSHYCFAVVFIGIIVALIYGAGFWIVMNDKIAIETKIASENSQSQTYSATEAKAKQFQRNLLVAKQILQNETNYSSFLTTLADDLPSGAIVTNLSLGNLTPAQQKTGVIIDVRTASYEKVLETKSSLEKSKLFENVSIVNVKRPEDISKLSGQESRYPYEVSYNVKFSADGATQ